MVKLKELERWLTSSEAAELLGRSKPYVIGLAKKKRLKGVLTHAGWLFDPDSVEELRRRERS